MTTAGRAGAAGIGVGPHPQPNHSHPPTLEPRMPDTTNPQTFRRRPAEIEAVQWTDDNATQLAAFAGQRFMTIDPEDRVDDPDATASLIESAHESWALLMPGDWVVKRGDDFAVLSPEEFADLYEPAPAPSRVAGEAQQNETQAAPLRAELKPWQLLAAHPDEPLPQTERLVGGRRLLRPTYGTRPGDATVDPAMCPRCKGGNTEAFELCSTCAAAEQPAVVSQPGKEA